MAKGEIKIANKMTLNREVILEVNVGGPNKTTSVLKCEGGKQKRKSERCCVRRTQPTIVGFEDEPTNVGDLCGPGRARKCIPPQSLRKGIQSCQHLDFSPVRPISEC